MGFSAAAVIVIVGGMSAFQTSTSSQASGPTAPPDASQGTPITVSGCLMRGEQASTPATGTTGALQVPPQSYVLINAATSEGGAQPADVTTFLLEDAGADLASSVGKRVEVTGTMPAVTGTTGTTPPSPGESHEAGALTKEARTAVAPAVAPAAKLPRIRVTSVRAVDSDCSSSNTTPRPPSRVRLSRSAASRMVWT